MLEQGEGPMFAERSPMRKMQEVLRLKYACGPSKRVIAEVVGVGRTAVGEYARRAAVVGIAWPTPSLTRLCGAGARTVRTAGLQPTTVAPGVGVGGLSGISCVAGLVEHFRRQPC